MIIAARNLSGYFKTLQFPVEILEEKGDRVARVESRRGLLALIEVEAVIGIGTWNRIRHLRLNRPIEALAELRIKLQYPVTLPASTTVVTQQLECGRRVHSFDGQRCVAYREGRAWLDIAAL